MESYSSLPIEELVRQCSASRTPTPGRSLFTAFTG
jgi:hypothetical protein